MFRGLPKRLMVVSLLPVALSLLLLGGCGKDKSADADRNSSKDEGGFNPLGAVLSARDRQQSTNNLKQIGHAFHNYHDERGQFPGARQPGKPPISWRVELLPHLEADHLFRQYNQDLPWDHPENKKVLDQMPRVFAAPGKTTSGNVTYYQAFVGRGTMFDGTPMTIAKISDGTSNTILVVEAGEPIPWTKPDDMPYDPGKPLPRLGGLQGGDFHALFCDGAVRVIKKNTSEKVIRDLISPRGEASGIID